MRIENEQYIPENQADFNLLVSLIEAKTDRKHLQYLGCNVGGEKGFHSHRYGYFGNPCIQKDTIMGHYFVTDGQETLFSFPLTYRVRPNAPDISTVAIFWQAENGATGWLYEMPFFLDCANRLLKYEPISGRRELEVPDH